MDSLCHRTWSSDNPRKGIGMMGEGGGGGGGGAGKDKCRVSMKYITEEIEIWELKVLGREETEM